MRKGILFSLLCLIAIVSVACGGGNNATGNKANGTDGAAACGGGDGGAKADAFALYKKEGRSWTSKSVTKIAGMDDMVSYMKTEVTKVADDHAMIKTTMMDKDKKPMAGMEPTETKIEFKTADATATDTAPKVETKDETVKVEAGEFDCTMTETSGTKVWMSKEYPGLMVKMEHASGGSELVEFNK